MMTGKCCSEKMYFLKFKMSQVFIRICFKKISETIFTVRPRRMKIAIELSFIRNAWILKYSIFSNLNSQQAQYTSRTHFLFAISSF